MHKSIFMYSLLALGYFVFSTLPFTEVSAQTITIISGNNQSTTRGNNFPNPVVFRVAGGSQGDDLALTFATIPQIGTPIDVSQEEDQNFTKFLEIPTITNGDYSIYVQAKNNADKDSAHVIGLLLKDGNHHGLAEFTGTITDVLYFPSASTTRNVNPGVSPGTDIGAPVSATHWANEDDTVTDVTLAYSLEGTDAASFDIDSSTGQLKTKAGVTYIDGTTYSVRVKVRHWTGSENSSDTINVTITVNTRPLVENTPVTGNSNTPVTGNSNTPVTGNSNTPVTGNSLTVKRVGNPTVELSWNIPTGINPSTILEYQYSMDTGQTWTPTGSTDTSITINGDHAPTVPLNRFRVRAIGSSPDGTVRVIIFVLSAPIIYECPVGWMRSDGFAGRNRRVLLYEVKLEMDLHNLVSIYQPDWVAIYVHPDEGLENLEGWKLQVAIPYNRHRDYLLTAENSVVVDAGFVEGGFAFIENPEEDPFPMVGMGFTGALVPGFDYRLYDDTGRKVDFGIACYKRGDIFQVLKEMEDPRVLRNVLLERFDWDQWFLRSEWTVPVPVNAPGAPSLHGVNVVGKWADLKKQ